MGGRFSLPDRATEDPVNGQPQQPGGGGVIRMAKSLCQSIYDFFKECLYSRWCFGDFDSSMVNTWSYKWNIPPMATQNPNNKRSDLLGDTERRASDSTQRQELELTEALLRNEADENAVVVAGNKRSDPLGETKTSLEEKLSNAEEVTTALNLNAGTGADRSCSTGDDSAVLIV